MKKYKTSTGIPVMTLKEDFTSLDFKPLDSKNRITLSGKILKSLVKKMKFDAFQVFLGKNGDILLRPTISIPSSEAWLYKNKKALKSVEKGLEEAREGKGTVVKDLDSFLEKL